MAYATSADAGFRIVSLKHGTATLTGGVRATLEKVIDREIIQATTENTPTARPVDRIDARVTYGMLDGSSVLGETTTPANCIAAFTEADGGSGSVTVGPMVVGGWTVTMARNQDGHQWEQNFEFQGTALTETISF